MPIDYSKYPPNWKTEIVPRILKRAGNKCEKCGLENKQKVYSMQLYIRSNENGRYGHKTIWLRDIRDAKKIEHLTTRKMKVVTVILTIAHLDHDETNHEITDDRLMAMCQWCHLNYDAKEKYRRACEGTKNELFL